MELLPQYEQELAEIKEKMIGAQEWAKKFPEFADRIIAGKFDKNFTGELTRQYKTLYFGWGVKRCLYTNKENITNYRGDFTPQYLFNIYINQYSLFDDNFYDDGIFDVAKDLDLFFFDRLNTTFYATDEQLMPLLDALVDWYEKAKPIHESRRKEEKRRKLQAELEKLA